MIVFDLKCGADHVFEGWFGSSSDFEDQRTKGMIACPFCGDTGVAKAVMAPNVGSKGNQSKSKQGVSVATTGSVETEKAKAFMAAVAKVQSEILSKSEWVGRDFDTKARAMDAGEIEKATIHGEVTKDEAKALIEDGIDVMPLPLPVIPPDKQN